MSLTVEQVVSDALYGIESISETVDRFPWHSREHYGNWCAQTFYYVNHATRLLANAAARATHEESLLHQKCVEGISEEKDHENMALSDLTALGFNLSQFPELPMTSAYYQTLYFMTNHDGPISLIGYFLPLEGLAAKKLGHTLEYLEKTYGREATYFLRVHCKLDTRHFDEGCEFLETCTPKHLAVIHKAIVLSSRLYNGILHEMISPTFSSWDNKPKRMLEAHA
jgi:hypothetical protein